jgi:hypothetical protein
MRTAKTRTLRNPALFYSAFVIAMLAIFCPKAWIAVLLLLVLCSLSCFIVSLTMSIRERHIGLERVFVSVFCIITIAMVVLKIWYHGSGWSFP